ncbi:MAG: FimV/HubP family polar landmark protein [Pseudomonadota bacterium]
MLKRTAKLALLLLMQTLALPTLAQSLGEELILSRLGDPVEVEIEVRDWSNIDLTQVQIVNATQPQYTAFNLTWLPILDSLSFNLVGPNRAGEVKILVSSREPVSEPFMDLLLVLRWPEGSSLREYVLLFDPPLPEFEQEAPRVSVTEPAPAPAPVIVAPPQTPIAVAPPQPGPVVPPAARAELPGVRTQAAIEVERVAPVPEPVVAEAAVEAIIEQPVVAEPAIDEPAIKDGRLQYEVRSGETLWDIARQFNPAGVSENLYQFLISAHGMNRNAFINGNISMLKVGAVLSIPLARDISAINPSTAQDLFEQLWGPDVPDNVAEAPAFTPLNEPAQEAAAPTVEPEPDLPPGTERLAAVAEPGLLLPTATPVVVALAAGEEPEPSPVAAPASVVVIDDTIEEKSMASIDEAADNTSPQTPVPAIQVIPQRMEPPVQTTGEETNQQANQETYQESNPYLAGITQSATAVRDLLSARRQRMADLEQQILRMQQEMEQAEQRAQDISQGLEQGGPQQTDENREILLLAGVVAALLLALGVTVKLGLQWDRETRMRARTRQAAVARKQAIAHNAVKIAQHNVTSAEKAVQ